MTSASLRALKAVTRAMFPRVASRVTIQEISPPRMNTYMIMALCCKDDSQRIFPEYADTRHCRSAVVIVWAHLYQVKLLWRINHTPWILSNPSDKLRISTDTFALFTSHDVTDIIRTVRYIRSAEIILLLAGFFLISTDIPPFFP